MVLIPSQLVSVSRACVVAALLWAALSWSSSVRAQTPFLSTGLELGTGMTWGNGQADSTVSRRSPLFIDASLRTWSDESPTLYWGGSVRMEIEGRTSIAVVPRVELAKKLGSLTLIPGVGAALFFAPFSMVGVEVGTALQLPLSDTFSLGGHVFLDGFFFGSDVPEDSAVIMLNLMFGAVLAL